MSILLANAKKILQIYIFFFIFPLTAGEEKKNNFDQIWLMVAILYTLVISQLTILRSSSLVVTPFNISCLSPACSGHGYRVGLEPELNRDCNLDMIYNNMYLQGRVNK